MTPETSRTAGAPGHRIASGAVLLSFDDRHVRAWAAHRALLDRHQARVTFFIAEPDRLDDDERRLLRTLARDGHSIGAHGWRHRAAPDLIAESGPQGYLDAEIAPCLDELDRIGVNARSFAYPNSRRNPASDAVLATVFERLRGGVPRTGDGGRTGPAASVLVPSADVATTRVILGCGVDNGRGHVVHPGDLDVVAALFEQAAARPGVVCLYAHDIAAAAETNYVTADTNYVTTHRLRRILELAGELGLALLGFDDLPPLIIGFTPPDSVVKSQ